MIENSRYTGVSLLDFSKVGYIGSQAAGSHVEQDRDLPRLIEDAGHFAH
jgi:hypothetical protein